MESITEWGARATVVHPEKQHEPNHFLVNFPPRIDECRSL